MILDLSENHNLIVETMFEVIKNLKYICGTPLYILCIGSLKKHNVENLLKQSVLLNKLRTQKKLTAY